MKRVLFLLSFLILFGSSEAQRRFAKRGKTFTPSDQFFSGVSTNQSGNVITVSFTTLVSNQNQPPSIETVTITGTPERAQTLTANLDGFFSPGAYSAGTHTYQWYRADNFQSSGAAIVSATNSTYVLTIDDVAKYIRVEITPVQSGGMNQIGTAVSSIYTDQIQDNVWNPITDVDWFTAHLGEDATDLAGVGWINRGTLGGANSVQNGSDPLPTYDASDESVDFELSNSEELVLDLPSPQFSMPVEIWIRVKFESFNGSFSYPIAWNGSQRLEQRANGIIYLSGATTGYTVPLNQWVVMRFLVSGVSNTSEFNVNDLTEITDVAATTTAFGTSNGRIGANSNGTGNWFDGKISHIFVKSGELSAPDQAEMWNWFGTNAPWDNPWFLAGGLVPASINYTIYDAMEATSQANSYVNLADPGTRDMTAGVAPTWSATTGWVFDGVDDYLITSAKFLTNSTLIIWYEDWTGIYVCGSTKCTIRPVNAGSTRLNIGGNTDINGESQGGVIGVRAGLNAYRNNIQFGAMGSFPGGTDYDIYFGARNNAGSPAQYGGGKIYRVALYDFKLSDAQMEAVISAMYNYQTPAADPYESVVMGLNPICYYPMTQKYGSALYDISGNDAPSQINKLPVGQPGLKGFSVAGDGTTGNHITTYADWDVRTGVNMDDFSAMCWIKVESDATNQIRVWNVYSNSGLEYCAAEVRLGLGFQVFLKANGLTQNTSPSENLPDDTWVHLVMYNDSAANEYGFYINGVRYNFTRTVGNYVDTSPDFGFPSHMQDMFGNMQHIAYFDHALTQSEVDILYVP